MEIRKLRWILRFNVCLIFIYSTLPQWRLSLISPKSTKRLYASLRLDWTLREAFLHFMTSFPVTIILVVELNHNACDLTLITFWRTRRYILPTHPSLTVDKCVSEWQVFSMKKLDHPELPVRPWWPPWLTDEGYSHQAFNTFSSPCRSTCTHAHTHTKTHTVNIQYKLFTVP